MKTTSIEHRYTNFPDYSPLMTGKKVSTVLEYSAMDTRTSPHSIAASSIMELRFALSNLGLSEGHQILDQLEAIIASRSNRQA